MFVQSFDLSFIFQGKGVGLRAPLDNIHPLVDNNKNIQAALCHGTKSSQLLQAIYKIHFKIYHRCKETSIKYVV